MTKTMGEIIRELRCSRNLTQEQLAENLNVTAQTISKWENSIGMPDISQVMPIAHFFGVSTDTLFGVESDQPVDEIQEYISRASGMDSFAEEYAILQNALKQYPGDIRLLCELLSCGYSRLADGDSVSEPERTIVFEECEKAGNLIMSYCKEPSVLLETSGWLIKLYCEVGNTEKAVILCDGLPCNVGFNKNAALARVYETESKYDDAALLYESNCNHYEHLAIHSLVMAGNMHAKTGNTEKAIEAYSAVIRIGEDILENPGSLYTDAFKKNVYRSVDKCRKSVQKLK